jgi:hypothetical protein
MKYFLSLKYIAIFWLAIYTFFQIDFNQHIQAQTNYSVEIQAKNYPLTTQVSPAEIIEFNKILVLHYLLC